MEKSRTRLVRLAGLCGLVAPVFSLSLILYAVAIAPWFNWHRDALSDLGVYPRASAVPFNLALMGGGLLTVVVIIGLAVWLEEVASARAGTWRRSGWLRRAGAAACLIGAVAVALVGVFPENWGRLHWYLAAMYFLLTPLGYVLLGVEVMRLGRRVHGALSVAAGTAAFLAIVFVPHDGLAVPELVAALLLGGRVFEVGMELWLGEHM